MTTTRQIFAADEFTAAKMVPTQDDILNAGNGFRRAGKVFGRVRKISTRV